MPRLLKRIRNSAAYRGRRATNWLGIDVRRFVVGNELERCLRYLLAQKHVHHVVDVGANVGQFAQRLRGPVGFAGRIDSFEPVSSSYEELAQLSASDPRWFAHRLAITEQPGEVAMHLYNSSVLNSLSRTTSLGDEAFSAWVESGIVGTEIVPAARLDDVEIPNLGPVMLKLDTQGHDWSVIASAPMILGRVEIILIELAFELYYEQSMPAWESMKKLDELGFSLSSLHLVSAGKVPGTVGEADGLFVRRPAPHSPR